MTFARQFNHSQRNPLMFLRQKFSKIFSMGIMALIGAITAVLLMNPMAVALDKVTLVLPAAFGTISIDMADLETLVKSGEAPSSLKNLLDQAKVKPETFKTVLAQEVDLSKFGFKFSALDKFLNSPLGEALLGQVAQYVHTPKPDAAKDVKALRGAITLAVSDDSKVSLMEILRKFSPKELQIQVTPAIELYNRFKGGEGGDFQAVFAQMKSTLQGLVCNAPTT